MPPKPKVLQVLFSGLGGHGSVFMSLVEGDVMGQAEHGGLFFGIEEIKPEYVSFCEQKSVACFEVKKNEGIDFNSWRRVFNVFKRYQPDVILLHSLNLLHVALLYRLFNNTKLVVVEHTPLVHKTRGEWVFSVLAMLLAPKIVLLTDDYKRNLKQKLGFLFNTSKTSVIGNGINLEKYRPAKPPATKENELVISMVARFTSSKDQGTLVRAFGKLESENSIPMALKLHLAGSGENLESIKKLVQDLGLQNKVELKGLLSEEEIIPFLQSSVIYVHSSLSETMSTAVMQAMAVGLPVIGSDINGINNIIKAGETGLLFEVSDPENLAEKLRYLIQSPAERIRMGQNARQQAMQEFSHEVMFNQYFALVH